MLLENGADVNFETTDGRTALYAAVRRGHAGFKRVKSKKELQNSSHAVHF